VIDAAYCQQMARYGQWMNLKHFELASRMSDSVRRADRGAFFGSIHATLNHILVGDLSWLSRFTNDGWEIPPMGTELQHDFADLRRVRAETDARLIDWAGALTAQWLAAPFVFTSISDGIRRELPTWVAVTHLFQHGTHHRGQLTTLYSQLGLDIGDTDLPKLPEFSRAPGA
jgi:uncharacterized damage-inducible protein DinB